MRNIIFVFLLPIQIFAGTISFIGPCQKTPVFTQEFFTVHNSVGAITVDILSMNSIPFKGTEKGMNSIFKTPTGLDAMEVISDTEMMAYGWCYSVNGFEPAEYPSDYFVAEADDILWWFGYAHYKNGKWITQCTPSHLRKSKQFCP